MKSNLQNLTSRFLAILMTIGLCAANVSCTDPETTDSTKFAIFYAGVTDIGPSMNFNMSGPTYIGGTPSDFAIARVTLNGEVYDTNCFQIETNTGAISISETKELAVGLYALSISCRANGSFYEFKDIVSINMMRAIPEGIYVEPNKLKVEYEDIINTEKAVELPTAQVKTDGNHISIKKYIIANIRKNGELIEKNDYFKVSNEGIISITKGKSDITPGKYVLDLKLTTAIVDEEAEEGIFENAIEIDVTSQPLSLIYAPNSVKAEENTRNVSTAPAFIGSTEGLVYSIKSTTPQTSMISIEPTTGIITLAADNKLEIGTTCNVSITATNQYGSKDFDNVYTINIVEYIEPISEFNYNDTENIIQATAFEHPVNKIIGGEVTYSFVNLDSQLSDLSIDPTTGTISAQKGNNIPIGEHTITVLAKNNKSELQTSFKLNIQKNPYYFTYVDWGNNLNLSPIRSYASQYRVSTKNELSKLSISVADSDIPEGIEVKWAIKESTMGKDETTGEPNAEIDNNGKITFNGGWVNGKVFMLLITATTGKGTPGEITIKTPVFIHCAGAVDGVTVNYTPFVFQVNPRIGGTSAAPVISGVEPNLFKADYRRTFNYYNINGPEEHISGQTNNKNNPTFMNTLWQAYYAPKTPNYGQKWPLSYYDDATNMAKKLGYVDESKNFAVTINPNKWQDEYGYANGVMIGQITFIKDGNSKNVSNGKQIFPIAIWFDTAF